MKGGIMKKIIFVILILAASMIFVACTTDPGLDDEPMIDDPMQQDEQRLDEDEGLDDVEDDPMDLDDPDNND